MGGGPAVRRRAKGLACAFEGCHRLWLLIGVSRGRQQPELVGALRSHSARHVNIVRLRFGVHGERERVCDVRDRIRKSTGGQPGGSGYAALRGRAGLVTRSVPRARRFGRRAPSPLAGATSRSGAAPGCRSTRSGPAGHSRPTPEHRPRSHRRRAEGPTPSAASGLTARAGSGTPLR